MGLREDQRLVNVNSHVHLHHVSISANREREATSLLCFSRIWFACLESARREYGLLRVVKGDSTKLLPIPD